jgi:3'(2'), 5'-bisphosphate nucleotidase
MPSLSPLLLELARITRDAGALILEHYAQPITVNRKEDDSPVTGADLAANALIVEALSTLTPDIPIIAEEGGTHPSDQPIDASRFWLVDPLDGTKSFIQRTGEFTVNIGLIENGIPVLGAIYVPVQDVLYLGDVARGAWRQGAGESDYTPIHVREVPVEGMDVVTSTSHGSPMTDALLTQMTVRSRVKAASSLKFCVVAEGRADLYPRLGPTMEWDTAAGHAILVASGGVVVTPEGGPFLYGKTGMLNGFFVAASQMGLW